MDAKFCIVSHCTKLNACAVGALFIRMISIYYSEGFFAEPPPTFLQVAYYLSQALGLMGFGDKDGRGDMTIGRCMQDLQLPRTCR